MTSEIRAGAGRIAIALLFAAVALPAAAQSINSPHALFRSSLNGAAVRICGLYEGSNEHLGASYYVLRGWPALGAGTLTVDNVTEAAGNCTDVNLSYTGSFSVDQQIHFTISERISSGGGFVNTGSLWVHAADPALVVGDVAGTPTEEGGRATIPVRLRTRPAGNVTIAVTSTDTTEGTVSPSSLAFTQGNWNANQTVTATGVNDNLNDGDVAWNVRLNPASISGATVIDSAYNGLANVNVSVTTLDQTGGPTHTAIAITSTPANAAGYRVGENIDVRLTFSQAVTVTGTPLLALGIGTDVRQARYESSSGTNLFFRYPVVPGDADGDGILSYPLVFCRLTD